MDSNAPWLLHFADTHNLKQFPSVNGKFRYMIKKINRNTSKLTLAMAIFLIYLSSFISIKAYAMWPGLKPYGKKTVALQTLTLVLCWASSLQDKNIHAECFSLSSFVQTRGFWLLICRSLGWMIFWISSRLIDAWKFCITKFFAYDPSNSQTFKFLWASFAFLFSYVTRILRPLGT